MDQGMTRKWIEREANGGFSNPEKNGDEAWLRRR